MIDLFKNHHKNIKTPTTRFSHMGACTYNKISGPNCGHKVRTKYVFCFLFLEAAYCKFYRNWFGQIWWEIDMTLVSIKIKIVVAL